MPRLLIIYAPKTRTGCECVAHVLQSLTDLDEGTTVVSVDGVGAFDLVSRNAMLNGLLEITDEEQLFPFARLFYSQPSTCLWDDDVWGPPTAFSKEREVNRATR